MNIDRKEQGDIFTLFSNVFRLRRQEEIAKETQKEQPIRQERMRHLLFGRDRKWMHRREGEMLKQGAQVRKGAGAGGRVNKGRSTDQPSKKAKTKRDHQNVSHRCM